MRDEERLALPSSLIPHPSSLIPHPCPPAADNRECRALSRHSWQACEGDSILRRAHAYSFGTLLSSFCLAGPLLGQTLPRTVRVATIGHVGTPRSLTVAVEGGWRLIDLGDHHLVGEGTGPAEWRFRIGSGGRVSVEGDR